MSFSEKLVPNRHRNQHRKWCEVHTYVIPLHSLKWSIHTKDESKCTTAFSFIFGVNWLWLCGVTAYFGVCFHEIKCNAMTSFMELMQGYHPMWGWLHMILMAKVQRIHIAHLTNCSRLAKMIAIETQETKDNSVLRMTIRNPNAPTCEWAVQWTLRQKTP